MDNQSPINDDACKYIIENTIKECNRVLNNWRENQKPIGYDENLSLFRGYLSKFFKHKFGWEAYVKYIRRYYPLVTINNHMVINIDFNVGLSSDHLNVYVKSLNNYVLKMDILKFSELQTFNINATTEQDTNPIINVIGLVDYKKLENIKFN